MSIKHNIGLFINKRRRNWLIGRFARLARNIYWASEHAGYDVQRNGEAEVMVQLLKGEISPIVVDVGANKGDWSACVLEAAPSAVIHAIEASPSTAERLSIRFRSEGRLKVHPCGLARESGEVDFYDYPAQFSELSGARVPLHSHIASQKIRVPVFSGDHFCVNNTISEIALLKVDVEGLDLEVLRGFSEMLRSGRIRAIQFELEGGSYLLEFYQLLSDYGYKIGKLYSNYVDFRPHSPELEWFLGPNYIAVREELSGLIQQLKAGW